MMDGYFFCLAMALVGAAAWQHMKAMKQQIQIGEIKLDTAEKENELAVMKKELIVQLKDGKRCRYILSQEWDEYIPG